MASSSLGNTIVDKLGEGMVTVRKKFTFSFEALSNWSDGPFVWTSPLFFDGQTKNEWCLELTKRTGQYDISALLYLHSSSENAVHALSTLVVKYGSRTFNSRTCRLFKVGGNSPYEQNIPENFYNKYSKDRWTIFVTIYSDIPDHKVKECFNECLSKANVTTDRTLIKLRSDMGSLLEDDKFSDVVVEAADSHIRAHKCILSARSPVFRAMFAHDMRESSENCVKIQEFGFDTVRALMNFIYTGRVDISTKELAMELFRAADKYQASDLKTVCEEYLATQANASNCMEFLLFAEKYSAPDLKRRVLSFMCADSDVAGNSSKAS